MDVSPDISTDDPPGRWVTLAELAAARGIDVPSAQRLVRRRQWRRQPGNDGKIRVLVPPDELKPNPNVRPDDRTDVPPDRPSDTIADIRADIMEVAQPLRDAIAVLRVQLDEANTRTVRADVHAEQSEARAMRAEEAVAAERVRADVLRDRLESAQAELRRAQEGAEALRRAEAERRARGRLRRTWDGWRGR